MCPVCLQCAWTDVHKTTLNGTTRPSGAPSSCHSCRFVYVRTDFSNHIRGLKILVSMVRICHIRIHELADTESRCFKRSPSPSSSAFSASLLHLGVMIPHLR